MYYFSRKFCVPWSVRRNPRALSLCLYSAHGLSLYGKWFLQFISFKRKHAMRAVFDLWPRNDGLVGWKVTLKMFVLDNSGNLSVLDQLWSSVLIGIPVNERSWHFTWQQHHRGWHWLQTYKVGEILLIGSF